MKKEVTEIKTLLKDFLKSAPKEFASKEDHRYNLEKINKLGDFVNRIAWSVAGLVFTAIGAGLLQLVLK